MAYKKFIGLIGCGYWGKNLARDFNYLGVLRRVSDSNNDAKNEVNRISKNILSVFSNAISSSVIAKGTTFLKGKENSQIFNKNVNIVDKSDIKRANGSKYFDKEGVRVDELDLVKDGVLKNLLVDTYNGKKINKRSNGRCGGTRATGTRD